MPSTFTEIFKEKVCPACGYCGKHLNTPGFCVVVYHGDKDRFFKILKYLMTLRKVNKVKYNGLYNSFEGFVGLWCNSSPKCPNRSAKCKDLSQAISCFSMFLEQNDHELDIDGKSAVYKAFSGIDLGQIGLEYTLGNIKDKQTQKSLKSAKKQLQKAVRRKYKTFKNALGTILEDKKVTTSFFYREDNKSWIEEMEKILGEKLTKNEPSTEN